MATTALVCSKWQYLKAIAWWTGWAASGTLQIIRRLPHQSGDGWKTSCHIWGDSISSASYFGVHQGTVWFWLVLTHTQVIICRLNNTPHASQTSSTKKGDLCIWHPQYCLNTWRWVNTAMSTQVDPSRSKYHQVSIWELLPRAVLQTGSADWTLPIRRIDSIFTVFYSHWDVLQVHNL